ncbi:NAD(P)/FAD-dependent oxidoreductase [Brevibacterium daeguense]|uniref:NAD(P)/FAD-dependent oxidoreductase n=1 Tax=Brevibacterium daeguense TaxID=909936 RepID=A0ABP8EIJ2_9MICO|nr:NAD(P)/FAD-dependent oxidoreductase [Brevibacterium daeguense]
MTTVTNQPATASAAAGAPETQTPDYDAVIVGAGFSGMYQLHRLRQLGMRVRVIEAGDDVGGTWYWNRYPGARVDIESRHYSYSFDDELQQEWDWSERYAAQPELLDYARHVADRFDLHRDITFGTRVSALDWQDRQHAWTVTTDSGERLSSRFVILATGCLSVPQEPTFDGLDEFRGEVLYTSRWPHEGVDLSGKRVAVIGTGSSGLQTITAIAPEVASLTVLQRTPNFAIPAHNHPLTDDDRAWIKENYPQLRGQDFESALDFYVDDSQVLFAEHDEAEIDAVLEERWRRGGLGYTRAFADSLLSAEANARLADFARAKIRERVADEKLAQKLMPFDYPVGAKRMCVDTGYFEVYNRDNVRLIDIGEQPIEGFTASGIVVRAPEGRGGREEIDVDVVVMATGFDAMTGAVDAIDITSDAGSLRDKWQDGPRTYLGLMTADYPNLFTITGPQSPSVLTNMMTSIEYHVDFISRMLEKMTAEGTTQVAPRPEAEEHWVNLTNDLGALTLMPKAQSWYMGANIPGKPQALMPFVGGSHVYINYCEGIVVGNYHGFAFGKVS